MDNIYCSYYTKSTSITNYMVNRLNVNSGDLILEPCAGDGVFIDKLLENTIDKRIIAYDLNPEAIKTLKEKYKDISNIEIYESDTLIGKEIDTYVFHNGNFDKVIGNPPYGAWQDYDKRIDLKKLYKGFYVKETYTLFLLRCVSLLKEGGILSFIIPDTFMNLHMHNKLREFLLLNTKILEILIFPSNFFPGVNFGYSNMCIVTLKKCTNGSSLDNTIRIIQGLKKVEDIDSIMHNNIDAYKLDLINQQEIYESVDKAFFVKSDDRIREIINNCNKKLGDLADCVTGFYSGENNKFLKVASSSIRNQSNCDIIKPEEINHNYLHCKNILDGISDEKCYIPIAKGSSNEYVRENNWYVNWSKESITHYKSDKKARFQNSQFYFKRGIAITMVKSSKVKASVIDGLVFDQSIVGIFPKEEKYFYFILALLNSDMGNTFIHTINPSANSSANYIKKIPIILPDEKQLNIINSLVIRMIDNINTEKTINKQIQEEIDDAINEIYLG